MLKRSVILCLFIGLSYVSEAQNFFSWAQNDRYFTAYIGVGRTGYFGELTNGKPLVQDPSSFNIGLEARLFTRISARAQITRYKIEATDDNAPDSSANIQRNLSFTSNNWEFVLQGVYYFHKYSGKYHTRKTYEPYIAVGFGKTTYNPKAELDGQSFELRGLRTEGKKYGKSAYILPLNFGVKGKLNEFMNLTLDLGYRIAFTDYLDDVSQNYITHLEPSISGSLANRRDEISIVNQAAFDGYIPGGKRGDNAKYDKYFSINLFLEFYLPRDLFKRNIGKVRKEKIIGKPGAY